jgi:hypothetical protein
MRCPPIVDRVPNSALFSASTPGNPLNADERWQGDGTGALDEDERAELSRLWGGEHRVGGGV